MCDKGEIGEVPSVKGAASGILLFLIGSVTFRRRTPLLALLSEYRNLERTGGEDDVSCFGSCESSSSSSCRCSMEVPSTSVGRRPGASEIILRLFSMAPDVCRLRDRMPRIPASRLLK